MGVNYYTTAMLAVIAGPIIFLIVLAIRRAVKGHTAYKMRYKKCLDEVDDALVDTYTATRMIMIGADPIQITATTIEAVMTNYLIQRIFVKHGVLYFSETSPKWIHTRLDQVKETRII